MSRGWRLLAGICALAFALFRPLGPAMAGPPSDLIDGLNKKFIEVMKDAAKLGYSGRYAALAPVLGQAYDFPEMTRVSMGRYWRDLTDAQKQQLTDGFQAYSTATYAARFNGFSGEKFQVLGEESAPAGNVRVNNQIVQSSGEPIRIDYLLRQKDGQFRIIDVFLKSSFSELAIRRTEFAGEFAKTGYDGVIALMKAKVAKLASDVAATSSN
ncbi:MAG TPA: ABC transporter substrate-binding protein [Rhizomicrobium sp.]|nr:ABC transporter substrate-binding protein [Rhizomicrobium sp.]